MTENTRPTSKADSKPVTNTSVIKKCKSTMEVDTNTSEVASGVQFDTINVSIDSGLPFDTSPVVRVASVDETEMYSSKQISSNKSDVNSMKCSSSVSSSMTNHSKQGFKAKNSTTTLKRQTGIFENIDKLGKGFSDSFNINPISHKHTVSMTDESTDSMRDLIADSEARSNEPNSSTNGNCASTSINNVGTLDSESTMEVATDTSEAASGVQFDTINVRIDSDLTFDTNPVERVASVDEPEINSSIQTSCNKSDVSSLKCSSSVPSGMTTHSKPDSKAGTSDNALKRTTGFAEDIDKSEKASIQILNLKPVIYNYKDKVYNLQVSTSN